MNRSAALKLSCFDDSMTGASRRRLAGRMMGAGAGILLAGQAFAGGADVSTDSIYTDDVVLATEDGVPLDINGDGNVDLAIASNRSLATERSRYYLGNGDGTFSAAVLLTAGASSEIAVGDLNGDMILDLVQTRRDATDLFYLGDGAGMGPSVAFTTDTNRTLSVALGDLDLDGDIDIVTGNGRMGGNQANPAQVNRFYLSDLIPGGTLTFTGADISADADDTRSIVLADIDGDGDLDVIAGNDETTAGSNRVYLNQFIESGMTAVSFGAGIDFGDPDDQTSKILVGDLDGDTDLDIVTTNFVSAASSGVNRFFINDLIPGGTFGLSAAMNVSADTDQSSGGVLADFDGDLDLDLAVANLTTSTPGQSSRNRLYLNQVAVIPGSPVSFGAAIDISADEQRSRDLDAFDLNGDGHIDIVVGNQDQIAGVSGLDRRYLNNGTADPFTNVAPVIDAQAGPFGTDEDTDLTITLADVTVTDPDNVFPDDFTLTVQAGTNYTVTGNTITPDANFAGDLTVPVIVNDGTDDSAAFDLTVTVTSTDNDPPSFTSVPVTVADEGMPYTYNITASDPDPGDALTITAPTLPAWLTLTDNGDGTGTLTGTPAAGDAGPNDVSLQVSDGALTGMQDFTITVGTGANDPPMFDSVPVTAAVVGVPYVYLVMTSDPDGDTLAITATTLPGWLTLVDNGDGTATLSGTPAAGDSGANDVSLQVSDGTLTATQPFTITVTGGAGGNDPPSFTSTPVTDATEGTAYTYAVTTSDSDAGDTLVITAPTLPDWLTLTDNGDGTATLAGTPAAGDVGPNDVSLEVSDGTATAMQDFTITVEEQPADTTPPVITLTGPSSVTVTINSVYNDLGATATDDVDGDLTAEIVINSDVDTSTVGSYTVTFDVTDSAGNAATTVSRTVMVVAPRRNDGGGGSLGVLPLLAMLGLAGMSRRRRRA